VAGHGEKLSRKQEQAIAALLAKPTLRKAAEAAGVSERTLRAWVKEQPAFLRAWRDARRRVVEHAVGQLQRAAGRAVRALVKNLACGQSAVEVRAAVALLDKALGGVELVDLLQRVEDLELRAKRRGER
jgi:hypothetical protein